MDAAFPSSIIVAVGSDDIDYLPDSQVLAVRDDQRVARILDGQHRVKGLENYTGEPFELIVTVFVDMDMENQALMFATINLEQKTVNKSLTYDLYDYMKARSPQKTAHSIVRLLNSEEGTPFRGRIKVLGRASEKGETISQALFVDNLLKMISTDPMRDRDELKRGRKLPRSTTNEERESRLIFRNMFIDEHDAGIAKVLWNYFGAVEDRWPEHWKQVRQGFVLNRTTGFVALMQFLPLAYLEIAEPGDVPPREGFRSIFDRIDLSGDAITPENYVTGTSGQSKLRDDLRRLSKIGS